MRGRRGDRGQSAAKRATLGLVTAIAPETGRLTLLDPASPLAGLLNAPIRTGTVTWIGLRPERRQPLLAVANAELDPVDGLLGDHYRGRTNNARQVTLMQAEHLAAIATYLGIGPIEPDVCAATSWCPGLTCWHCKAGDSAWDRQCSSPPASATHAPAWKPCWASAAIARCADTEASPHGCSMVEGSASAIRSHGPMTTTL